MRQANNTLKDLNNCHDLLNGWSMETLGGPLHRLIDNSLLIDNHENVSAKYVYSIVFSRCIFYLTVRLLPELPIQMELSYLDAEYITQKYAIPVISSRDNCLYDSKIEIISYRRQLWDYAIPLLQNMPVTKKSWYRIINTMLSKELNNTQPIDYSDKRNSRYERSYNLKDYSLYYESILLNKWSRTTLQQNLIEDDYQNASIINGNMTMGNAYKYIFPAHTYTIKVTKFMPTSETLRVSRKLPNTTTLRLSISNDDGSTTYLPKLPFSKQSWQHLLCLITRSEYNAASQKENAVTNNY